MELKKRMTAANTLLAADAVFHDGKLGREHPEVEDAIRFPFQRDRDRIIHAQSFRRLQGKTQVFVAGGSDHFRTRLTHSMEVAQIARDIARALRLNEDLTECIALAHDLGHPPFGHAGEAEIDAWMREHGSRFEHNKQSHRTVTLLEVHSDTYAGLNLQREVTDGLLKHSVPFTSREAAVVNKADEIAYLGHDIEDGMHAGLFTLSDALALDLVRDADDERRARGTSLRGGIIHLLASDLIETSMQQGSRVAFSQARFAQLPPLHDFLHKRMYEHPLVRGKTTQGRGFIRLLCASHLRKPPKKILALMERTGSTTLEAVKDYVAGMTDTFALTQAQNLSRHSNVLPLGHA